MANNRLDEFITHTLGLSRRKFADLVGSSHSAANFWANDAREIPYTLSKRLGVNYAWLNGDESQMWNERVLMLRHTLQAYLAEEAIQASNPSDRFRVVIAWLREQAPVIVWDEYIACLLRLPVETYREYASADVSVGQEAIARLAWFTDVPVEWFAKGERRLIRNDYEQAIRRAQELGIPADWVTKAVESMAASLNNR